MVVYCQVPTAACHHGQILCVPGANVIIRLKSENRSSVQSCQFATFRTSAYAETALPLVPPIQFGCCHWVSYKNYHCYTALQTGYNTVLKVLLNQPNKPVLYLYNRQSGPISRLCHRLYMTSAKIRTQQRTSKQYNITDFSVFFLSFNLHHRTVVTKEENDAAATQ